MVIRKKFNLIVTYRQDKKISNSVIEQDFLLQKAISKQLVVTSKIKKNCTGQPNICRNWKEHSKIRITGDSHIGKLKNRNFVKEINGKVRFNVFWVCKYQTFVPFHPAYSS